MNIKNLSQEQKEKIGFEVIKIIENFKEFVMLFDLSESDKQLILENHNCYNQEEYSMIKIDYLIEDTIEHYDTMLYSVECDKNGNLKTKNTEKINEILSAFQKFRRQCPKNIYISWEDEHIWN